MDLSVRSSILIALAGVLVGCGGGSKFEAAPNFTLEAVDPPIEKIELKSLKGKVLVLDFWATWCGPCKATMPQLEKIYRQYKDKGVRVMGIADEPRATLRSFRPNSGVTYPFYLDMFREANVRLNIQMIPMLIVVDKQGRIRLRHEGAPLPEAELKSAIEASLAESG